MTAPMTQQTQNDAALRRRAARVIPGGMYGHQSAGRLPPQYPQFFARAEGTRLWDVDGREYLDLMCSYGPVVLGHRHPRVEAAARAQAERGDCYNGPGPVMVELSELLVDTVRHADWSVLSKNGTDAMTMCLTIARATTGRRKVLRAGGAYHGAAPWCTPSTAGVLPEDRAHLVAYRYNDLDSVRAAVAGCEDDLAAIVVSPFRHDAGFDQEVADPAFARGVRALCDSTGAALILDDVRAGFRLHHGASWEPLGVEPDLSGWSKAIANGHPLAAALGNDRFRGGAEQVYVTGSFWFSAVAMAAGIATVRELEETGAVATMVARGQQLRDGLAAQAEAQGLSVRQTGPVQMPFLTFDGDVEFARANVFAGEAARRGVYLHPWHNWFVSAALSEHDVAQALLVTDDAFAAVRRAFGDG